MKLVRAPELIQSKLANLFFSPYQQLISHITTLEPHSSKNNHSHVMERWNNGPNGSEPVL